MTPENATHDTKCSFRKPHEIKKGQPLYRLDGRDFCSVHFYEIPTLRMLKESLNQLQIELQAGERRPVVILDIRPKEAGLDDFTPDQPPSNRGS